MGNNALDRAKELLLLKGVPPGMKSNLEIGKFSFLVFLPFNVLTLKNVI